jgi:hypothetical protein
VKGLFRSKPRDDQRSELIDLGPNSEQRQVHRWGFLLVVFMRLVAVLWLFQGLLQWKVILAPEQAPIDALPSPVATAIAFFAEADLLAAVGLWLAAAWGGVLWLFSACAGIIVILFMPEFHAGGLLMVLVSVILIVIYFVLTWNAAQERE